ncbi:MAG: hypothetical protein CM15mP70_11350 [Pelagibacteraceae bacterium]|nr:MAG: hypothetical protein CM15mP70_11350 [Pelagibacteraceae bacterium]
MKFKLLFKLFPFTHSPLKLNFFFSDSSYKPFFPKIISEVKMKLVTAIIKPEKREALRQALTGVDIQGFNFWG